LLGICLGHQAIAAAWGAEVVRAPEPKHGIASLVHHDGRGEFAGLPNPFQAGRYHSLMVRESTLPRGLEVSARTEDGIVMAVRAREGCVVGWQFHPESILTQSGYQLLAGFLRVAGLEPPTQPPLFTDELRQPPPKPLPQSGSPVTF
ncbi:MAG: gamma-glutamyl-gamma-aminobutyrate hydrolase family protein, partial [Planctomycetales bacterium]